MKQKEKKSSVRLIDKLVLKQDQLRMSVEESISPETEFSSFYEDEPTKRETNTWNPSVLLEHLLNLHLLICVEVSTKLTKFTLVCCVTKERKKKED